ncbi:MAG TPA: TIGR03013 family XrtA/PEP-CTERM system glycosyltransferase [Pyrinomonadaceae bacterium]|jgi:sugar transferase (PEP-CTERM system associated)
MSKRFSLRLIILLFSDTVIICGGILMALFFRLGEEGAAFQLTENLGWLKIALAALICLISLHFFDLYDYTVIHNRRELSLRLVQALGTAWGALALIFYFAPFMRLGPGTSIFSIIITMALLLLLRTWVHFFTGHPEIGEKIVIVGSGKMALDTAEAILERRDAGFRIAGYITDDFETIQRNLPGACYLGDIYELENALQRQKIDRIIISLKERRGAFPDKTLMRISLSGDTTIEEGTSFYERITGRVHLDMLRPSWLIFSGRKRETRFRVIVRGVVNRLLALTGLILSLPIALLTAVLIKLDSKGDIFYRQERVGKNGRLFQVIKFRSMKTDAEADGKPVWAIPEDDRVTRVGRVIRKIRVDEIPQFWNILKGEMSFVGPRPERPHFVSQLAEEIPFYEYRHLVAPGLTGWAQIKYPYGASVEDARQKLQFDLYYIKNQSLFLDVMIFFETIKIIMFGRGAR